MSPRTDKAVFEEHCAQLNYEPISFISEDENGHLVYHTNVMLTIGNGFAVICLDSIKNAKEQKRVLDSFAATRHEIIDISFEQMNAFAGNMLQVENINGDTFLVMSQTALNSLNDNQIQQIKKYTEILAVEIPVIETIGGGSARCMLAEIYLEKSNYFFNVNLRSDSLYGLSTFLLSLSKSVNLTVFSPIGKPSMK